MRGMQPGLRSRQPRNDADRVVQRLDVSRKGTEDVRLKLIACEIFYRELCAAVARSVNQVDLEFLPKGLHDIGQEGMNRRLQEVLAGVDPAGVRRGVVRLRAVQQRRGGPEPPRRFRW